MERSRLISRGKSTREGHSHLPEEVGTERCVGTTHSFEYYRSIGKQLEPRYYNLEKPGSLEKKKSQDTDNCSIPHPRSRGPRRDHRQPFFAVVRGRPGLFVHSLVLCLNCS
jgi:hypothetical protein